MSKINYYPDKYSTRSRRSQRSCGTHSFSRATPTAKLSLEISAPCGACEIPYTCPVPSSSLKLGSKCMIHLMSAHRTWACVFNINSWCTYSVPGFACYAQDQAPEGELFNKAKQYRQAEMDYFLAIDGRYGRRASNVALYAQKLVALKTEIASQVGAQNLHVCAYYPLYKSNDHLAVINRTDKAIPRLLTSEQARLKGQAILV